MFVYVAAFEGRPGLIKIGVATNVKLRMTTLSKAHGAITRLRKFMVGESRYVVETDFHKRYADYNKKLPESCDGYTEFFSDCVRDEVEILLKAVAEGAKVRNHGLPPTKVPAILPAVASKATRMDIENQMSVERLAVCDRAYGRYCESKKRGEQFLERLLGNSYSGTFNVLQYQQLWHLATVIGYGVEEDSVIKSFINIARDVHRVRLTTWRAKVVLRAINGEVSESRADFWRRVFTSDSIESFYLGLVMIGKVDEETLKIVISGNGDTIKLTPYQTINTRYLCDEIRRIIVLRNEQVMRR